MLGNGSTASPLLDGTPIRVPDTGSYALENGQLHWVVEGRGVEPDIAVDNDPYLFYFGGDTQLREAVSYASRTIKESDESNESLPSKDARAREIPAAGQ